jgi:NitT/TauT family transport system ATP-binding protein
MTGKPDPPFHVQAKNACAAITADAGTESLAGPFTIDIPHNAFVALVGPAACGSSALLRLIAGLASPASGDILVRGEKVAAPLREVGFVFSEPALLASRTALGNVLLQAELHRLDPATEELRARELLSLIGAGDHLESFPQDLTPAVAQRVAICRALLLDPELLLMDDPFRLLDPLEREQLVRDLQRFPFENRLTVVMASTGILEAVQMADLLAVVAPEGRIERVIGIDLPRPRRLDKAAASRIAEYCTTVRLTLEALGVLT